MAIDPNLAPGSPETGPVSIIENEIPAYRAISSGAVFSLLLGVASVFCFTHLAFLFVAVAALLVGVLAIRNIARHPDILTGANFARAGITLALVFGISAVTSTVVQGMMLTREATGFANQYLDVLRTKPLAVALWYQQPPAVRNTRKPDDLLEELKKSGGPGPGGDAFTMQSAPILRIKERLKGQGEEIHFEKIEARSVVGLTSYANALIEVHGPGRPEFPEKEEFLLVRLRKDPGNHRGEWTVEELVYPYKPSTYVEKAHPPDDGHGHGH